VLQRRRGLCSCGLPAAQSCAKRILMCGLPSCALDLLVSPVYGRRVGALLLKGEWQEAVSTIMQPRGDAEANEVSEARRLYCDHGAPSGSCCSRHTPPQGIL